MSRTDPALASTLPAPPSAPPVRPSGAICAADVAAAIERKIGVRVTQVDVQSGGVVLHSSRGALEAIATYFGFRYSSKSRGSADPRLYITGAKVRRLVAWPVSA